MVVVSAGETNPVRGMESTMMLSMTKWLDITRLRLEKCRWRLLSTVFVTFALLTFFFVYDRSYLESALTVFDQQFAPLLASCQKVGDGATTAAGTNSSLSPEPPVPPPLFPGCNIFDGRWVYDETYPLYGDCHLAERDFQCHRNGRPDRNYQKLRWQPHECSIPRFDAEDMLARLNGLRVVIVGDSMGRTQWESLNCLLLQGVPRKASVVLVRGPITKRKSYFGTRFKDHNVSVDYRRSTHIVLEGKDKPKSSPGRVHTTLKLNKIDHSVADSFLDADVLVLNTAHWWTSGKTYDAGCYFQLENKLMLGMPVMAAYKRAMRTVTSWVNDHVNFDRTEVFFRTYAPPHWEKAPMTTLPYTNISHPKDYPRARILKDAVGKMKSPAILLNVTSLSSYRPDAHVFNWTGHDLMDAAHWCLPGVPDTWNQLLYASLLMRGRGVWSSKNGTH